MFFQLGAIYSSWSCIMFAQLSKWMATEKYHSVIPAGLINWNLSVLKRGFLERKGKCRKDTLYRRLAEIRLYTPPNAYRYIMHQKTTQTSFTKVS